MDESKRDAAPPDTALYSGKGENGAAARVYGACVRHQIRGSMASRPLFLLSVSFSHSLTLSLTLSHSHSVCSPVFLSFLLFLDFLLLYFPSCWSLFSALCCHTSCFLCTPCSHALLHFHAHA